MATVEMALALPVLMFALLAGVALLDTLRADLRCADAARVAAAALTRGEAPAAALALARADAPAGAVVSIAADGSLLVVRVALRWRAPGQLGGWLPVLPASGSAAALAP
ncbi:MAG: TadE family type IV pilus minor pilin [Mycobacteriales bacterium]